MTLHICLLHLHVFLTFLRITRGFNYSGKYISQLTRIIGSLIYIYTNYYAEVNGRDKSHEYTKPDLLQQPDNFFLHAI